MKNKTALGAFLAIALAAGAVSAAPAAQASGIGLSAKADAHVKDDGHRGLRGAFQAFFSRHQGDGAERKGDKADRPGHGDGKDRKQGNRGSMAFVLATVTAVDGDAVTATSKKDPGITWTVALDGDTKLAYRGNEKLEVGDLIAVSGTVTDDEGAARAIDASFVLAIDADYAAAHGTITAVDDAGGTITVATKHQGDVTVAVDSATTIQDRDGDSGVFADLVVGTRVRIQGLWNSLHDLVTAAAVRVKADF